MKTKVERQAIVGIISAAVIFIVAATVLTPAMCIAFGLGVLVGMTWIAYWHNQE